MPDRPPADSDEPTDRSPYAHQDSSSEDAAAHAGDGGGTNAGSATSAAAGSGGDGEDPPARQGPFVSRHKILLITAVAVVLLLVVGGSAGYLYWANNQLDAIPRVDAGITPDPKKNHNEAKYPLNILLLGADHGNVGQSVAEDLADGKWTPFEHLSDTIIVMHIPADRKSAQLISIPRDSWVKVHGYPYSNGYAKINAAFSFGGPELAIDTVQKLTGMTIDHVAMIDWVGFRDVTSALGGVRIYIPESFTDTKQNVDWVKGYETLEGERALQYVRTRHDLPGPVKDDFGRIARQQNFMRALMGQLLAHSTTRNPIRFGKVLNTLTKFLTVDRTWDNDEIRNLAFSLRNMHSEDVKFVTAPFGSYDMVDGQSIVRLDRRKLAQLVRTVENDHIERYLTKYPEQKLAGAKSIN
ncbi:MAG: LCP family protein [Nocardioidaceae bacterium]|nr:LCP family protein [Nocardioidaceae bacterium]